jgi:hypothetical protein
MQTHAAILGDAHGDGKLGTVSAVSALHPTGEEYHAGMLKHRLVIIGLLAAVVFVLGLLLGMLVPRWGNDGRPKVYNTAAILTQVQGLSQLVTVKYVMQKVQILEDPPQNVLRQLLPDNTRVILIAHGIVKAGVDLGKLKAEDIVISGSKILLTLPRAQITDAYLDEKNTQVIERTTGFLRSFNKDLEQTTRQNAIDDIGRAARTSGILKDADERARQQLTHLFQQLGFEQVEFRSQ